MIAMHNIQNKENTMTLENNIWEAFKNVGDFESKISQWKSNCYFYEACIREHLRIKGLRINNIGTFYDSDLRSRCREHAVEAERKITYENFEFAKKRKKKYTRSSINGRRNCLGQLILKRVKTCGIK